MPRINQFNRSKYSKHQRKARLTYLHHRRAQQNEQIASTSSTHSEPLLCSNENDNEIMETQEHEQIATTSTHSEPGPSTSKENVLHEYTFISKDEYDSIKAHKLCIEKEKPSTTNIISGNRLVNLQYVVDWCIKLQVEHSKKCTTGQMKLIEEHRNGLISILVFKCDFCDYKVEKSTQIPSEGNEINIRATWATLATGSTFTPTNEFFSVLNVPNMSYDLFHSIEGTLETKWKAQLQKSLEQAGQEEREIAIKKGHVDADGIPWTSVYCDGGWSKRSYGHSFTANSGVAVIIGKYTGKVLFMGVRNKYCVICARAAKKQEQAQEHKCYKNWDKSSSSMETSIIVEGFQKSLQMHGLKYKQLIGDGDSSVYANIVRSVPYTVEKIECKNHAIKNVGKALHNIKKDTKLDVQGRKLLTINIIKNMQNTCMKLIGIHTNGNVDELKEDFINMPFHIFGDHTKCKEMYCNVVGDITNNKMDILLKTRIYHHISAAIEKLILKARQLIQNENNNKAEQFMSIISKMNAGKRLNLTGRGSFETRAVITALRYNNGVKWQHDAWKETMSTEPGIYFDKCLDKYERHLQIKKKKSSIHDILPLTKKLKIDSTATLRNTAYGPHAVQAPISETEFSEEKEKILRKLVVNVHDIDVIEQATIGQWENAEYISQKKFRLTASNFGVVYKRRPKTHCQKLVNSLKRTGVQTKYMEFGRTQEIVARELFQKAYPHLKVRTCGMFIHENYPHLAASPDGVVDENAIIEIKCLLRVEESGLTLLEAAKQLKNLPVKVVNDELVLNTEHNYYYQIQGQLNICKKDICYFVVYIDSNKPLFVQQIKRNEQLWEKMVEKLNNFYFNCFLPKLIDPNRSCSDENHKKQ